MIRIVLGTILFCIAVVGPWWFALLCTCMYVFRYTAYEIILFAMILDAHVGIGGNLWPVPIAYTLVAGILVLAAESIKPYLRGVDIDHL